MIDETVCMSIKYTLWASHKQQPQSFASRSRLVGRHYSKPPQALPWTKAGHCIFQALQTQLVKPLPCTETRDTGKRNHRANFLKMWWKTSVRVLPLRNEADSLECGLERCALVVGNGQDHVIQHILLRFWVLGWLLHNDDFQNIQGRQVVLCGAKCKRWRSPTGFSSLIAMNAV